MEARNRLTIQAYVFMRYICHAEVRSPYEEVDWEPLPCRRRVVSEEDLEQGKNGVEHMHGDVGV